MTPSNINAYSLRCRHKQKIDPDFQLLNVACVFSPPAEGDADVKQIQEDLAQEREDSAVEPEKKKEALKAILADHNSRYGSNHSAGVFDLYYQDVQKRIKSGEDLAAHTRSRENLRSRRYAGRRGLFFKEFRLHE